MQYTAKVSNIKMKLAIYEKWLNISEAKKKLIHSKIKQCPMCLHGTLYNAHVHYTHSARAKHKEHKKRKNEKDRHKRSLTQGLNNN